jgi:hypothetical protein
LLTAAELVADVEGICDLLRDIGLIRSGIRTVGIGASMRDTLRNWFTDQ